MKGLKDNLKLYLHYNKHFLIIYTIVSYVLLFIMFHMFQNSELGLDPLFVWSYQIATPLVLVWITFRKVHLQFYYNVVGRSWWPLIISLVFAIVIPFIPVYIYTGMYYFRYDNAFDFDFALQAAGIGLGTIPFVLYTYAIILERKYNMFKSNNQLLSGLIVLGFFVLFGGANLLINDEDVRAVLGVIFVSLMFGVLPIYLVVVGYRKVGA